GIRDFHVTGVQTCALPICRTDSMAQQSEGVDRGDNPARAAALAKAMRSASRDGRQVNMAGLMQMASDGGGMEAELTNTETGGERSEERRVGKECRARGSSE